MENSPKHNDESAAASKQPQQPTSDPTNTEELSEFVQNQLAEMQKKLQTMTDHIMSRIDSLGTRINDLERNMNDLIEAAEVEPPLGNDGGRGDASGKRFDLES